MNEKNNIITLKVLRFTLLLLLMVGGMERMWGEEVAATVKMTYVDYNNEDTSYGEISEGNTAIAGYNTIGSVVGFGNTGWNYNYITYIQVDASSITGFISNVQLTAYVSGSIDGSRSTIWGIGYNTSTWSSSMTYNTADKSITTIGETVTTTTNSHETFELKSFDITEAFTNDDDNIVTLVVYETAAGGGYIKNPTVTVTYTPLYNVNLTDVGQTNPNKIFSLPTLSGTITSSNTSVATNDLNIKSVGETTITATEGALQKYILRVNGTPATTSSTTFTETRKYDEWKLTSVGTLAVPTTIDLDYIDMSYGYEGETAVAVSDGSFGNVLKIIDSNGFSHANTTGNSLWENQYGGTFYKFVTTVTGTLQVTGRMSEPRLLSALTTSSVVAGTTFDGSTFTAANLPAGTYYLYNSSTTDNGTATATALMSGFRFTLPEQSLSFAWNDNPVKYNGEYMVPGITHTENVATNASADGGAITYTSSNPNVATVDANTGAFTMVAGGQTTITATAAAVPGRYAETSASYQLYLNVDDTRMWVFDNALKKNVLTTNLAEVTGLTLVNTSSRMWIQDTYLHMGVDCEVKIPAASLSNNDVVEVVADYEHGSVTMNITNGIDVYTWESNKVYDHPRGIYRWFVADGTQDFIIKNTGANGLDIRAIYVYKPATTTGTMVYNGGVNLQAGGGTAFKEPGDITRSLPSMKLDSNDFRKLMAFSSDNPGVATVDVESGEVTPIAAGTTTIHAWAYPVGAHSATYTPAHYTTTITVESSVAKSSKTIAIRDLMYSEMASSTDGGLDRVIPNFNITITGGDKVMSNIDGTHLIMNGGTIRIAPRYVDSHSKNVYITNAVVYYNDGTAQQFSNATDLEYIDIKKHDKEVTHIYVDYRSSDYAEVSPTDVSSLLNNNKVTPTIAYSFSKYQIEKGYKFDYINPNVTPKNLRGIYYSMTHLDTPDPIYVDGKNLSAANLGTTELYAVFYETTYFNSVANFKCMEMEVVSSSSKDPVITFPEKLYLDTALYPTESGKIDGFVFGSEILEPYATIDGNVPSGYTVTYSSSDKSIAYPNSDASKIHTGNNTGLVTITATFMPDDPTTTPVIAAKYQLQVLDGMWDFRNFKRSTWASMTWEANGKGRTRNTADIKPFLLNAESGAPLDLALGLQSKYRIRLMYDDHGDQNGFLELWGSKDSPYYETNNGIGSVLRVPVRKGMVVEINARCSGEHADMYLEGLNTLDNTTPATTFYVDETTASQYFIANRDGYFDILNPSVNLYLYINYIRITSDMEFKYGNETYIKAINSGKFTNPILNQGTSTITYTIENIKNLPAASVNGTTGEVTLGMGAYGQFEVTATAVGGELDNKTSIYTATVLAFEVSGKTVNVSGDSQTFNLRDAISTLDTGTTFGANPSDDKAAAEADIRGKVTFSIVSSTTVATLEGSMLTIEGAGTVTLKATLGAIEQNFTYTVTGASIGYNDGENDIVCPNSVIENDATSYTIKIIGSGTKQTFHLGRMKTGVMGDIKSSIESLTFSSSDNEYVSQTLTISGFDGIKKGGVIPIYASYEYEGETYELEGTLTIAYTEHVWRFEHNLLTGMDAVAVSRENSLYSNDVSKQMDSDYGDTHGLIGGLADWVSTTDPTTSKTAHWGTGASIDQPIDDGDHSATHDWKFVRKMGVTHPESSSIFYYNNNVVGSNALVIPETEGLVIYATKSGQQMGVEMMNENGVVNEPYDCRHLMMLRGGKITIPKVKPKQWIEVRWTRHRDDLGERLIMENLADVNGKYINEVYKIGNCYYNIIGNTSSYMFQVPEIGTPKGDGTYVSGENGYVDVTFEIADNTYISIQQITLHPINWDYQTIVNSKLQKVVNNSNREMALNNVITPEETPSTFTLSNRPTQNAPNAPATWECVSDATLTNFVFDGSNYDAPTITYNGGWGKAYITLTSYTQNKKYVVNRKTWVLTFGIPPTQTYPYTWDFTKYFNNTKTDALATSVFQNYNQEVNSPSETWKFDQTLQTWNLNGSDMNVVLEDYDGNVYKSYFVDGAQLVSTGISGGILSETEGLGFSITNKSAGGLTLDMQSCVAASGSVASNGETWKSGKLTITGGGTIIVPSPGSSAAEYYLYILSSVAPSVDNTVLESGRSDVSTSDDEKKQYCYHFLQDADAVLTFGSDANIYAIGVTNILKDMTPLSGTAWATESRNHVIDHSLTGYLTTNPVKAYAIIETEENPTYNREKQKVTVSIKDQRYVVPENRGIVMKQTGLANNAVSYNVPLFYPAVTTNINSEDFTHNLMRPNVNANLFTMEHGACPWNNSKTYIYFILAQRYMTWTQKESGGVTTQTYPTQFETGTQPVFYKLHVYKNMDGLKEADGTTLLTDEEADNTLDKLNTLGANKAYLILPFYEGLNFPLWWDDNDSPTPRRYIAIEGISDMEELELLEEAEREANRGDGRIYNLNGQVVGGDEKTLPAGIYIRNGKKLMVR